MPEPTSTTSMAARTAYRDAREPAPTGQAEAGPSHPRAPGNGRPGTGDRPFARVIGGLFLAGFLSYGAGSALVASVTSQPDLLGAVAAHRTILVLGALLMFLNTAVDVAKAVLIFPVLERHSRRVALTYLAAMIVEVLLLSVGVLGLLALVPLSRQAGDGAGAGWGRATGALLVQWNATGYQLGEMALAGGAMVLCGLLYRTRLLPRLIAVWGLIGYAVLLIGAVAELLGVHIALVLSVPGGLWEIALALWLIVKGFTAQASPAPPSTDTRHRDTVTGPGSLAVPPPVTA